jgi:fatty-acid desaturase
MSTTTSSSSLDVSSTVPVQRPSSRLKPEGDGERGVNLYPEGIDWPSMIWLGILHAGALAAPFTFTWTGLVLAVTLHWVTGGLGICLGFHRLFTHSSFKTVAPVRWALAWLGGLAGEGSVNDWVSTHRAHHALSDQVGDPHSPRDGKWWSHIFWIARARNDRPEFNKKWSPDLVRDPALAWISQYFLASQIAFGLLVLGAATLYGGWAFGGSVTVWAIFLRLVLVMHSTWLVNSLSHIWGYRNYETTDDSRNNWLVALFTYGEGWHNNHHAYPRMANHGHRWWEIDLTYTAVRVLAFFGLAWDVVDYRNHAEKADRV